METIDLIFQRNRDNKSDINEHLEALKALALGCELVVEFGVRRGMSTSAFIAARPEKMLAFDHRREEPHTSELEEAAEEAGVDFTFLQKSSREERPEFETCDLMFIDTRHTYEQRSLELELHGHKAGKYLGFHDTVSYPELTKAIKEFMAKNKDFEVKINHEYNNGLMVLERKQ